jgi:hypothetical protein
MLSPGSPGHQLDEGELAGAVDADIKVQLAFGCAHLGDVDVEVADGVGLGLPHDPPDHGLLRSSSAPCRRSPQATG